MGIHQSWDHQVFQDASLAGMPAQTGLYAALLPAVVGILWGSSPLLAVGPVALTSLLVSGSLYPLVAPGSAEWIVVAAWLAFYSGAMQFLLGAFRLGKITALVSQPVITGFVNAAAIIMRSLLSTGDFPAGQTCAGGQN